MTEILQFHDRAARGAENLPEPPPAAPTGAGHAQKLVLTEAEKLVPMS
jgi:hypothetical protein